MATAVVYLDTNIVGRIADSRVTQSTAGAYAALADMADLKFVTSEKAREEVRRATNKQRSAVLQLLVSFLDKVAPQTVEYGGELNAAPLNVTALGGSWTDPLYSQLRAIFDPEDAEHIVHAVRAGCDFFLTLDEETILKRVTANHTVVAALCGKLQFVSPEQLVAKMRGAP